MCGAHTASDGAGAVRLSLAEGIPDAVAELTAEAKRQSADLAALTRSIRDRLKRQGRAVADFDRALADTYAEVIRLLFADLDDLPPSQRQALANLTREQLEGVLEGAGLADLRVDFTAAQLDLIDAANDSLTRGGLPRGQLTPNSQAVRAYLAVEAEELWQDRLIAPSVQTIRRGMRAAASGRTAADIVPQIERELGTTRSAAATEARTSIATFDRTVTAATAEEAGAEWFIYRGPDDAITRPFCDVVVGRAFTADLIAELNNSQTMASPMYSGGGYNCRHAWLPVSAGFVERNGVTVGTMADVRRANAAAAGSR